MAPYLATARNGPFETRSGRLPNGLPLYDAVDPDARVSVNDAPNPALAWERLAAEGEIVDFFSGLSACGCTRRGARRPGEEERPRGRYVIARGSSLQRTPSCSPACSSTAMTASVSSSGITALSVRPARTPSVTSISSCA
jgi:hypothetical protein